MGDCTSKNKIEWVCAPAIEYVSAIIGMYNAFMSSSEYILHHFSFKGKISTHSPRKFSKIHN